MSPVSLPTPPSLLSAPDRPLIHRDLSWLQFNQRVLDEARDHSNPLLERLKFLSISSSNLDEFFMIRVASLGRAIGIAERQGNQRVVRSHKRVRASIFKSVEKLIRAQETVFDELAKALKVQGVYLVTRIDPTLQSPEFLSAALETFQTEIMPKLEGPRVFHPSRLSQLGNLGLVAAFPNGVAFHLPKGLAPTYVRPIAGGGHAVLFLDHLLVAYLGAAFHLEGVPGLVRLTRDGDFSVEIQEEDSESIPDRVRSGLSTRDRGRPVRLQASTSMPAVHLDKARAALKLDQLQIFGPGRSLGLHGLWSVVQSLRAAKSESPELFFPEFKPLIPSPLRSKETIFESLRGQDFLLHHPYDSFDAYQSWIEAACDDPKVTQIEQTVYRVDAVSPVIEALKAAAKKKRIRVVIELRARFDELNNLRLAEELSRAGVEVAFGFGKLKLHAKVALVTREENGVVTHYTHLSTGNYNAATARQYTDLAVFTARPEIGADAKHFFDSVCMGKIPTQFKTLVSAPTRLHKRILGLIETETQAAELGRKARIIAKVNALVDETIIEALYRASRAGVQVDLIVRGACSLIPGVPGLSENIRVISIVDRYLEHSRVYYFESTRSMYLSSADWMPRNFFSRLELSFPILDERLFKYLAETVLPVYFLDNVKARELSHDGAWRPRTATGAPKNLRCQFYFSELARNEYEGTALDPLDYAEKNPPTTETRAPR